MLATGWPFLGEEVHSPVDIRQDECDRTDNKIDVLSKTFLGLTVSCARCHDHMFDAIKQTDYYALAGFVASSSYRQARFESMEQNKAVASKLESLAPERWRDPPGREGLRRHAALRTSQTCRSKDTFEIPDRLSSSRSQDSARDCGLHPARAQTPWMVDGPPSFGSDGVSPAGELILGSEQGRARPLRLHPYGAARTRSLLERPQESWTARTTRGPSTATRAAGRMMRTPAFEPEERRLHYLIRGHANVYAGVSQHIMVTGPLHGRLIQKPKVDGDQPRWVTHDLTPLRRPAHPHRVRPGGRQPARGPHGGRKPTSRRSSSRSTST